MRLDGASLVRMGRLVGRFRLCVLVIEFFPNRSQQEAAILIANRCDPRNEGTDVTCNACKIPMKELKGQHLSQDKKMEVPQVRSHPDARAAVSLETTAVRYHGRHNYPLLLGIIGAIWTLPPSADDIKQPRKLWRSRDAFKEVKRAPSRTIRVNVHHCHLPIAAQ
jgi:hypothetical protein